MPHQPSPEEDAHWMRLALDQARAGAQAGEVPVGAVVVRQGQVIGQGANAPLACCDPTAHAEVQALRAAAQQLGNYRLEGCTLYVTLEPCVMCAGAMLHARLARVVFGAPEPKTGAAGSVLDVFAHPALNFHTQVQGGVLAPECAALLGDFFRQRRQVQRQQAQPLRPDALRTPPRCFADCAPPSGVSSHYLSDAPALAGLRLHYLEVGAAAAAPRTWLLLHGPSGWSAQWHGWLQALQEREEHALAPDLIGFGRSDKLKKEAQHQPHWHGQVLHELLQRLLAVQPGPSRQVLLVLPADALALAGGVYTAEVTVSKALAALHIQAAVLACPPTLPLPWAQAPFPDAGHRAGPRAWQRWNIPAVPWPRLALDASAPASVQVAQAVEYFASA